MENHRTIDCNGITIHLVGGIELEVADMETGEVIRVEYVKDFEELLRVLLNQEI